MDRRAVQDFYSNKVVREAFRDYMIEAIEVIALEKMFTKKDVSHIADAAELLTGVYDAMEIEFAPKPTNNDKGPR